MAAGTLTLVNGSDAVVGVGTSFTDLSPGDYVFTMVGGIPYTMPIKSITSATNLIVTAKYTGPDVTGAAWESVPQNIMSFISAAMAVQNSEALRQLNNDKDNWLQVYTSTDAEITVRIGNGLTFTGPSWKHIADLLAAIDVDELTALAAQIQQDAQQVSTDKTTAVDAANASSSSAQAAAASESASADSEANAAQSKTDAEEANAAAQQAKADSHQSALDAAESALSVDAANLLKVVENLADLSDPAEARENLDVFSKEEVQDRMVGYLGQVEWQGMRAYLEPGTIPRDGQQVDQTGIYADLYAKGVAGKLPTCTETEWWADPLNRGCYVLESATGKMRLPDDNGVQAGSLRIPVKVGDGGDATKNGKMAGSELPNITGKLNRLSATLAAAVNNLGTVEGAFSFGPRETEVTPPTQVPGVATAATGVPILFTAGSSNAMYKDGVTEVRPNRLRGCWTVRIAALATNGGSIDALALATAIASGDAALSAQIVTTNARIDFAVVGAGTMAINTGAVLANPFGNNTPVFCDFQAYHPVLLKWISVGWQAYSTSSISGGRAFYSEGEGIIVRAGQHRIFDTNQMAGLTSVPATVIAANATACPVRILVWKVTA